MRYHSPIEYSGQPFGRPADVIPVPQVAAEALLPAGSTLLGQDSVSVGAMLSGLAVYAGYIYGTFTNWGSLVARFGGHAQLVSITPVVQSARPAMCLDVEPGDASPGDCPAFQRQVNHGGIAKPIYYTSAGDLQAVINALSAAGYKRSDYFLWSAHWTGLHICGPSTCGYPQADATQYASNSGFDSDVFSSYMFSALPPPAPVMPTVRVGSTGPAVVKLRILLDAYHAHLAANADGGHDTFGPQVLAAVEAFQKVNSLAPDGIVGPSTWAVLLSDKAKSIPAPPAPPKPAPLTATGETVTTPQHYVNIDRTIPGYMGTYTTLVSGVAAPAFHESYVGTSGKVTVKVPGPGTYKVTTSASGYLPSTATVSVPTPLLPVTTVTAGGGGRGIASGWVGGGGGGVA